MMYKKSVILTPIASLSIAALFAFGCNATAQEQGADAADRASEFAGQSQDSGRYESETSGEDEQNYRYDDSDYDESDYDESDYIDEDYDSYDEADDYVEKPNITLESGEQLPRSERSQAFHSEIEKVLSGDDFAHKETVTRRRFIDLDAEAKKSDEDDEAYDDAKFPEWIIKLVRATERYRKALGSFAQLVEILIWGAVIGLIIFIILKYRSQFSDWASSLKASGAEPDLPTTLFGLDIKKESIPDDVVSVAQGQWANGEHRQAIATLLRASLIKLLHEHGCRFFSSDTESECCDRIDQQAPSVVSAYMRALVSVWQGIAYAHVEPNKSDFDALCQQWKKVF